MKQDWTIASVYRSGRKAVKWHFGSGMDRSIRKLYQYYLETKKLESHSRVQDSGYTRYSFTFL